MKKHYVIDAILLSALGIFMLVRPFQAMELVIRIIGLVLLIMGAMKVLVFIADREARDVLTLLVGIVQLIPGVLFVWRPGTFVGFYTFAWGIIIAYGAIVSLVELIRVRKYDVTMYMQAMFMAFVTLLLAVVVILHPAMVAAWTTQLIGVSLVFEGVSLLMALSRVRRAVY